MRLLLKLKELFNIDERIRQLDEFEVQNHAANLRAIAIKHLRIGNGVVARGFRGECLPAGLGNYQDFLDEQVRNGVWGTYIEAMAIAEKLNCNLIVTPVKNGVQQAPICLHHVSDSSAQTIKLYNSNNTHWYVNNKTRGDGNCLYNAISQALLQIVNEEEPRIENTIPTVTVSKTGLFSQTEPMDEIIAHQKQIDAEIAAAIERQPTVDQLIEQEKAETARIAGLSEKEQKQIASDYQMALALAREEMQYIAEPRRFPFARCGAQKQFENEATRYQLASPRMMV